MDEQAGILQAIVENPDDITHRLVYADWLCDHGQDLLAEFIRSQCTLRRFLVDPPAGARYPVAIEIMSLQPQLREALLHPFQPVYLDLNHDGPLDLTLSATFSFWVHRGLVEDVEVYGSRAFTAFVRHAATIFARTPLLRMTLSRVASREAVRGSPFLLPTQIDAVPLSAIYGLLRRPEIARLRSLDLRDLRLGNDLGRCFLRCRRPLHLQRLMLDGNQIEDTVGKQLAQRFGKALELRPFIDDDIPF